MDLNQEIRSFTPIDVEKFSQNKEISEKTLESLKSYNKAIEYLKTGSEDIAMIELKKVVSTNPDFYEAINLLGLCYAYTNQMDKAEALFGKVVQDENNVIKAADYLNFISMGDSNSPKKNTKIKKTTSTSKTTKAVKQPVKKGDFSEENVKTEYLLFKKIGTLLNKKAVAGIISIFGIICLIAAVVLFFSSPKTIKEDDKISEPIVNTEQTKAYDSVVTENKSLKKQLESANIKLKQIQLSQDLSKVSSLYSQKKYVEAADKLMALPVAELNADSKTKYDAIKGNVLLKAANKLTIDGNALYGSKKYNEAIKKLEKVFTLGDKWAFGDKALYILGKSYVEVKEIQKGATTYQKLIDEYPKSSYLKYAKSRLQAIK